MGVCFLFTRERSFVCFFVVVVFSWVLSDLSMVFFLFGGVRVRRSYKCFGSREVGIFVLVD